MNPQLRRLLLDLGRLVIFFGAFQFFGIFVATAVFIPAILIALAAGWYIERKLSPMAIVTALIVVVFGGLTLYFHDQKFIQMKPTFVYALFAGVLTFGLATGRPLLQQLLGTAYAGLDAEGWRKLTRNWAVFFVGMACLNEAVWRLTAAYMTKDAAWNAWVLFKFPGCVIITLVFAIANVPMLLKHGLLVEKDAAVSTPEG